MTKEAFELGQIIGENLRYVLAILIGYLFYRAISKELKERKQEKKKNAKD